MEMSDVRGSMHMVCAYVENPGQLCGVTSPILPLSGLQIQVLRLPKKAPSPSETSRPTRIFQFHI